MTIKKHEDKYWHIRKIKFGIFFWLILSIIVWAISIYWIMFQTDQNNALLVIPFVILALEMGGFWILLLDKIN